MGTQGQPVSTWEYCWGHSHLMGAFEWISVSSIKSDGNKVAHVLVRFAQNVSSDLFWMEEVPSIAYDSVNCDASLI